LSLRSEVNAPTLLDIYIDISGGPMAPHKRLPGQSNDDYEQSRDPNAAFIGTQSLYGGGDLTFVSRALRAFLSWRDRRRTGRV
jgi:hypothetical protein